MAVIRVWQPQQTFRGLPTINSNVANALKHIFNFTILQTHSFYIVLSTLDHKQPKRGHTNRRVGVGFSFFL